EVGWILLEGDVVALHPFFKLERAGADRAAGWIAAFDRLLVDDLAVRREVVEERPERRLEMEDGNGRIGRLDRLNLRIEPGIGAGRLRIEDALEAVLHIG